MLHHQTWNLGITKQTLSFSHYLDFSCKRIIAEEGWVLVSHHAIPEALRGFGNSAADAHSRPQYEATGGKFHTMKL